MADCDLWHSFVGVLYMDGAVSYVFGPFLYHGIGTALTVDGG